MVIFFREVEPKCNGYSIRFECHHQGNAQNRYSSPALKAETSVIDQIRPAILERAAVESNPKEVLSNLSEAPVSAGDWFPRPLAIAESNPLSGSIRQRLKVFVYLSESSTQIGAKFTHSPSQAFAQEHP
jgi:hypothetical protein